MSLIIFTTEASVPESLPMFPYSLHAFCVRISRVNQLGLGDGIGDRG